MSENAKGHNFKAKSLGHATSRGFRNDLKCASLSSVFYCRHSKNGTTKGRSINDVTFAGEGCKPRSDQK